MFEKITSDSEMQIAPIGGGVIAFASSESEPQALRKLDWVELTARFSAARDLRQVLQQDMRRKMVQENGEFADAAARYCRIKKNDERDVNLVALEQRKGSPTMSSMGAPHQSEVAGFVEDQAAGDAREI